MKAYSGGMQQIGRARIASIFPELQILAAKFARANSKILDSHVPTRF